MTEQIQDEIIYFEDFNEYDISYPVIITRWEIRKVHCIDKQYLQVYFQKISDNLRAFNFNVKCYSVFGEVVDEIAEISIDKVDKKNIQFLKVVPLKPETQKVEIYLQQCCLLDNSVIEPKGKQMVVNTFKPFNEEDLEAGKRLLPNAKGYPIDKVSHWYCACGAIHYAESDNCERCNKTKSEIFSLITPNKLQEEKTQITKIESEKKKKKIVFSSITLATTLFTLIFLNIYQLFIVDGLYWAWELTLHYLFYNCSLMLLIGLLIISIIGLCWVILSSRQLKMITVFNKVGELLFSEIKFKKTERMIIIACVIVNVIACCFWILFSW